MKAAALIFALLAVAALAHEPIIMGAKEKEGKEYGREYGMGGGGGVERLTGSARNASLGSKREAFAGVKDLNLRDLEGRWWQLASSSAIHKLFERSGGCNCPHMNFKLLAADKFHVCASCFKEDGKVVSLNGTMTQVDKSAPGRFNLEFIEIKNVGLPIKLNKTEARQIGKNIKGEGQGQVGGMIEKGKAKLEDAKEKSGRFVQDIHLAREDTAATSVDANTIVLFYDRTYLVLGAPKLNSVWLLSRKPEIDDSLYAKVRNVIEGSGYSSTSLKRASFEGCDKFMKKKN